MSFKFQVKLSGQWVDYPEKADSKICAAYKQGKKEVTFQLKVGNKKNDYILDFIKMQQISTDTKKTRPVRAPYDLMKKFNADAKDEGPKEFAGDDVSGDEPETPRTAKVEKVKVDTSNKKKVDEAIEKECKNVTAAKRFSDLKKEAEKAKCDDKMIKKCEEAEKVTAALEKALSANDVKDLEDAVKKFKDKGYEGPIEKQVASRKKEMNYAKARMMITTCMQETAVTKEKTQEELEAMKSKTAKVAKECVALGLGEEEVRPARDRIRKLHNAIQDLKGAIRVYLRTRPFNQREKDTGSKNCLNFLKDNMTVEVTDDQGEAQKFQFDTTFAPGKQEEVFREMKELIQSAFDGYNVTVFAYGQTGAGKTYTMYGPDPNPEKDPGVVLRSIEEIFTTAKEYSDKCNVKVRLGMLELYCSALTDLLNKNFLKAKKIEIRKTAEGEVILENLETVECHDAKSMWKKIEEGFKTRQVAATAMNSTSSRSHCVVFAFVESENKTTKQVIKSKITLVDLAGSERVKDSGVEGDALKEAIEINKSLTALGDVMEQLTSSGKNVGYRNHLLTQLLQDSLGGSAKTLMFAGVSPASINHAETIMTMKWAARAKMVCNDGGASKDAKAKDKAKAKPAKAKPKK